MASDIARLSYDARQQYRSVVMQQGRVTLEADWNEAEDIAGEELRKEALDIVGPSGTPDNGYQIIPGPGFDFSVRHGTMYVGGERAYLFDPAPIPPGSELLYSQQDQPLKATDPPRPAEWLDAIGDPDWREAPTTAPSPEFIYLQLREQQVSAVEDSDLKDVALGGPDTAQRTRLVQHIVRRPGTDCDNGLTGAKLNWASQGLNFDLKTMRLLSSGRLQVGFTGQAPPPDPCQPQAEGGYLGADNQLIRVQISSVGQNISSTNLPGIGSANTLLWGYDDASFLYRVDVINSTTLHLETAPVDAFHQPRAGQAVEVLRPAAQLSNGEFVAAPTGFVTTVAKAYNPDTQTIVLTDSLPLLFGDGTTANPSPPRVFLRIWEQQLPFNPPTPVVLGATGLQVTLSLATGGTTFHVGDFWMFAVRPSTPQQVYPERLLAAPQPPNGPRLWACPLGVITWTGQAGRLPVVQECRKFFSPLTRLVFAEANGGPPVGPRNTLNFIGAGVTVADNPVASRIDVTLPAGSSSVESSPTNLLFPFVTNTAGFDTGISVANTTLDPFGTTGQPGKITFHYFGSPPLGIPHVVNTVPGQLVDFVVSTSNPGFQGYIIAVCEFAGAYGFAFISDLAAQKLASGYLAIVLPKRPIP